MKIIYLQKRGFIKLPMDSLGGELDGHLEKKLVEPNISLGFFIYYFLLSSFFSESVEIFIPNKMSHQKFESDENYSFSKVEAYHLKTTIFLSIPTIKSL